MSVHLGLQGPRGRGRPLDNTTTQRCQLPSCWARLGCIIDDACLPVPPQDRGGRAPLLGCVWLCVSCGLLLFTLFLSTLTNMTGNQPRRRRQEPSKPFHPPSLCPDFLASSPSAPRPPPRIARSHNTMTTPLDASPSSVPLPPAPPTTIATTPTPTTTSTELVPSTTPTPAKRQVKVYLCA